MDILARWRKDHNMSQCELGRLAGVPRKRISNYENGQRLLTPAQAKKIHNFAQRDDLIVGPEHLMPRAALRLFSPPARLSLLSEPNRSWAMCSHLYKTLKSTMQLPQPSILAHLVGCDSGLEEAFGCQLINAGGKLVLASPLLLGYDQHCLLGPNGRALGLQPRPCIYSIGKELAYAAFPHLTLIGTGFTYTVDFLVLTLLGRRRIWSVHEVDGGGHGGEYDAKRLKDLQLPTFRYTSGQIHCTDFAVQFQRQLLRQL